MQNLVNKFNDLKNSEKLLIIFATTLLVFAFVKMFVIDTQIKKQETLVNRASFIQQQQMIMGKLTPSDSVAGSNRNSGEVISDFLKAHNSSDKLRNIRTVNNNEQRYEIENIPFNIFLDLLVMLENNGTQHSSVQLKANKEPGTVNVVLVSQ